MTLNLEEEIEKNIRRGLKGYDDYDLILNNVNFLIDGFAAPQFHKDFFN